MSETAHIRKELRQSLVQHVFHYYEELKKTNSEEQAKKIVSEEVHNLLSMFSKEEANVSFLSDLAERENVWLGRNKKAVTEKDVDTIFYSEDVLKAIKLVKTATKEELHWL